MRQIIVAALLLLVGLGILVFEIYSRSTGSDESIHTHFGAVLFVIFVLWVFLRLAALRFEGARRLHEWIWHPIGSLPDSYKIWIGFAIGTVALGAYVYCHHICSRRMYSFREDVDFFHAVFSFSFSIFTFLIPACIAAGYIVKLFADRRRAWPTSMMGNCLIASVLPMCSCGAIPLFHGILQSGKVRLRSAAAFLITVPVLSPFVIVFSLQLGARYAILRVVTTIAMAIAGGMIVERLSEPSPAVAFATDGGTGQFVCPVSKCPKLAGGGNARNVFLYGWDVFWGLTFYVVIGVLLGTGLQTYVAAPTDLLGSSVGGIVLIVAASVPMFLCAGQEIVMLLPFSGAFDIVASVGSLPIGHAIAFSIAGPGICISSIALLTRVLGKRSTMALVAWFFGGSIAAGALINLLTGGVW